MTVKDIFELRKQGKAEEAYAAIRPMYAVHHGHYTTICMFWCASDVLKIRLEQQRADEALKIFRALMKLYPTMEDKEHRAHRQLLYHAIALREALPGTFSMVAFLESGALESLTADDWKATVVNGHPMPSLAAQLIGGINHELQATPTVDLALRCTPILQEALRHNRSNMTLLRLMALIYRISGEPAKAVEIYKQLLRKHHQSYLYSELASLATQPGNKLPLLAKALLTQREEKFRPKLHIQIAEMLESTNKEMAAYNLQESIRIRQAGGFHVSQQQLAMAERLAGVRAATASEGRRFLEGIAEKVTAMIR